jgi:hypothetical protein
VVEVDPMSWWMWLLAMVGPVVLGLAVMALPDLDRYRRMRRM